MKNLFIAMALFAAMGMVTADITSGLSAGSSVPAFQVTKVGGPKDGVKLGQSLCYR